MMRFAVAVLASVVVSSTCWADDAARPITLGQLYQELGKLVEGEGANRNLDELSIVIAPPGVEPLLTGTLEVSTNDEGHTRIEILANTGKCTGFVFKKYLAQMGFYIVEFCNHPTADFAWGDFHRLANASGGLGTLLGSEAFDCNKPVDYLTMPPAARADFC